MAIKIEECTGFVTDVETARREWMEQAKSSWRELKKLNSAGKSFSFKANQTRRRIHYPLWYSTFRIRKPLIYGRTPQIVGKDTAYGDDPIGRTAAICIERLGKGIMQSFPFDDTMSAIRDDMLATDFASGRAYYEATFRKEKVKEYLQQVQTQQGDTVIVDKQGRQILDTSTIMQDEAGVYRMSVDEQDVEHERVYFKHILNSDVYIDPNATKWEDVQIMAWATDYSERDFKRTYGEESLRTIPETGFKYTEGKRKVIRVFEYWDFIEREIMWFAEGATDFLPKPNTHEQKEIKDDADRARQDDIYGLEDFFPCPEPLVFNAPTDSFYPVTEFYQLQDLIEEIHDLCSKMFTITKAIRPRLLYDSGMDSLQKLLNEASTADSIGVSNLSQSLATAGGSIANVVAYLPIEPMVQSLINYQQILQTKLDQFYQLSGTSDLLQGKTDNVERTYGEQQMKAKYALNQIEPMQRGFQNYCKDTIELLVEMGLKNFEDKTLDEYIQPNTLDREDQSRYRQAIQMLKDDSNRRFRIDIETDSTIALNEEFDKANRLELTNAVTKIVDYTSQVLERPNGAMLAPTLLKSADHLIQGFKQGKQFVDEINGYITQAVQQIEQAQANPPEPTPPPPDPRLLSIQWEQQKFQAETPERQMKINIDAQDKMNRHAERMAELGQKSQDSQLQLFDIQSKNQIAQSEQAIKQGHLGVEQFNAQTNSQYWGQEVQLDAQKQSIDANALTQSSEMKSAEIILRKQISENQAALDAANLKLMAIIEQNKAVNQQVDNARLAHSSGINEHKAVLDTVKVISDIKNANTPRGPIKKPGI